MSQKFKVFKVYSNIPFSPKSYHIETSQLICNKNQLNGFYPIQVFAEKHFWIDISCFYYLPSHAVAIHCKNPTTYTKISSHPGAGLEEPKIFTGACVANDSLKEAN